MARDRELRGRAVRDAATTAGLAAVLLCCTGAVALAVVMPWAPALGDSRSSVCIHRGVPAEAAGEGQLVAVEHSWLPLGPRCSWQGHGDDVVVVGPGPGPSGLALGALVVAAGTPVVATRPARRRRRESPPQP